MVNDPVSIPTKSFERIQALRAETSAAVEARNEAVRAGEEAHAKALAAIEKYNTYLLGVADSAGVNIEEVRVTDNGTFEFLSEEELAAMRAERGEAAPAAEVEVGGEATPAPKRRGRPRKVQA